MGIHNPKLCNMARALSLSKFIAFNRTNIYNIYLLLLLLVLCCVTALKSLPPTSSIVQSTCVFGPLRSKGLFREFKVSFVSRTMHVYTRQYFVFDPIEKRKVIDIDFPKIKS